ncbi:MAG: B12-binding domain-containing radical SAM protein [Candidatus Aminicenantaceae bacterium]
MNILLVYPETPPTFWSFVDAVKFISKKSSEIPLGLITVAAMLPQEWDLKLIDTNVSPLRDQDILWADFVFLSGMNIHLASFKKILRRCNQLDTKVVAGGPLATTHHRELMGVDHFVLNEAEVTLKPFIEDVKKGRPQHVYQSHEFPKLESTPPPRWDLLKMKKYAGMSLQYSRGCPHNCEFCSIVLLNGHKPRTKSRQQFINELESLYQAGWRGSVFIVDDNFIGNKRKLKREILPAMVTWSQKRNYPFDHITEATINLADDEELLDLMVEAGFESAFIGIETPNPDSLAECGKHLNQKRDMLDSVKKMQRRGIQVAGGFIVGFDNDTSSIFKKQIEFIQQSGIVTAMVGLLNAPNGTRLYKRLKSENRLADYFTGDNMDGSINFIPKMGYQKLVRGYKQLVETIYSQKKYYERMKTFLREYHMPSFKVSSLKLQDLSALLKSVWKLGFLEKGKRYYWKLLLYSLVNFPKKFPLAVKMAIYGFHFRRVARRI